MNLIPGLSLRASEEAEIYGIDDAELGEFAYDFVEQTRELMSGVEGQSPTNNSSSEKVGDLKGPKEVV